MIGSLWRFIVGNFHVHRWKIIKETRVTGQMWNEAGGVIRFEYLLQCEGCGNVKRRKFT